MKKINFIDILQIMNFGLISLSDFSTFLVIIFTLLQIGLLFFNLVLKIKNNPSNASQILEETEKAIDERKEDLKK